MLLKGFSRKRFGKERLTNRSTASWLAVLFVSFLAFYSCQTEDESQAGGVDCELAALLPSDSSGVGGLDMKRLKATPVYRLWEESREDRQAHQDFDRMAAEIGLDPRRDLHQVLGASWIDRPDEGGESLGVRSLVVARGRFSLTDTVRKWLEDHSDVEEYRGVTVYHPPTRETSDSKPEAPGSEFFMQLEHGLSLVFFDEQIAAAGNKSAVMATIDRKMDGGPSLLDNKPLLEKAEALNSSNQIWSVSSNTGELWETGAGSLPSGINIPAFRIFRSMESSSLAADLTDGIDVKAEGVCATPEDAKTLAEAGRGMVALGRLTLSERYPDIMKLFDAIDVVDDEKVIRASVRMTAADFEGLLAAFRQERDRKSD